MSDLAQIIEDLVSQAETLGSASLALSDIAERLLNESLNPEDKPLPEYEVESSISLSQENGIVHVKVVLSENKPCTVKYKKEGDIDWSQLPQENSYKYGVGGGHNQKTEKLEPGLYSFFAFDHIDDSYKTDTVQIRINSNEPDRENDNVFNELLPFGGKIYGSPYAGSSTANSKLAVFHARRYRAQSNQPITAVQRVNRAMHQGNIDTRWQQPNQHKSWTVAHEYGLDAYEAGYVMPNPYSIGNGGLITDEIWSSSNGVPHKKIGEAKSAYTPMNIPNGELVTSELKEPVEQIEGETYFVVYRNTNPPKTLSKTGMNPDTERSKFDRNSGCIGLNGVSQIANNGKGYSFSPFHGDVPAVFYRDSESSKWEKSNSVSWLALRQANGDWVGDTPVCNEKWNAVIEGNVIARQSFTVSKGSYLASMMSVCMANTETANGSELTATLYDASGAPLRTVKFKPLIRKGMSGYAAKAARDWNHAGIDPVWLNSGSSYTVEFSAPAGAGIKLDTVLDLAHYGCNNINQWSGAKATISRDKGKTWSNWSRSFPDRDIAMYFTAKTNYKGGTDGKKSEAESADPQTTSDNVYKPDLSDGTGLSRLFADRIVYAHNTLNRVNFENGVMLQRFNPTSKGSDRDQAAGKLPDGFREYRAKQFVKFPTDFQTVKGGKFGFGVGGGSKPSGGQIKNDGFLSRFMWRPSRTPSMISIVLYSYNANRSFNNGGSWGDDHVVCDVILGEFHELEMVVGLNTALASDDGYMQVYVDNSLKMEKHGIQWQSEGKLGSNIQAEYQAFFGGGDPSFAPSKPQYMWIKGVTYKWS